MTKKERDRCVLFNDIVCWGDYIASVVDELMCVWSFDGLLLTWGKLTYSKQDLVSEIPLYNAVPKISIGLS